MEIAAVDRDDPAENGNAVMKYELISDARGLFRINSESGLITTTAALDRENVSEYSVCKSICNSFATLLSPFTTEKA